MVGFSVLIPDADEGFGIPVAYCLKTSGQVVHGFSRRQSRMRPLSNLFKTLEYATANFDLNSWLVRIDEIVARRQIDIVLPVSSLAIRTLSENRHRLACADKLVHLPASHIFDTATNKASFANFLAAHRLPQPLTIVLTPGEAAIEKLSALNFPVLVKPPLARGGSGIRRFENLKELEAFLAAQGKGQEWVVQEFVEGSDLCVNVLCDEGKIIASTVQHAIVGSSVQFAPGAGFEFGADSSAIGVAERVVNKLGWSGIANFDMRFDARRKVNLVLEINGRYWLSMRGSLHAGVNFPLLACEAVFGVPKSNRQVKRTRYFSGMSNAILSLFGGGRNRIRPSETDLGYFAYDPIRLLTMPVVKSAETVQNGWSALYPPGERRRDQCDSGGTVVGGEF